MLHGTVHKQMLFRLKVARRGQDFVPAPVLVAVGTCSMGVYIGNVLRLTEKDPGDGFWRKFSCKRI